MIIFNEKNKNVFRNASGCSEKKENNFLVLCREDPGEKENRIALSQLD